MSDWLERLRQAITPDRPAPDSDRHDLPRAAAVLLLELGATDAGIDPRERSVIEQAIGRVFGLDEAGLETLLEQAAQVQAEAHSLHEFTHRLRVELAPAERAEIVEWLWRVAYADRRLDRHEEHLVRRLADLLGVPHREFMRRKHIAGGDG